MKAKDIFVIVGVLMVVVVLAITAANCVQEPSTSTNGARDIDAGDIISGKLSNDRLNMGSGNGLDVDMVDGWHAFELSQDCQEPSQLLVTVNKITTSSEWATVAEVTGGGYLYTLTSRNDFSYDFPRVKITLDGNYSIFDMIYFVTGGYDAGTYLATYAQCNLGVRFNSSLKIELKSNYPDEGSWINVVYSTDL